MRPLPPRERGEGQGEETGRRDVGATGTDAWVPSLRASGGRDRVGSLCPAAPRLQQLVQPSAGIELANFLIAPKQLRTGHSPQQQARSLSPKPRSLSQAQHWYVVLLQKFPNPLLASLAHVSRIRVWVDVMRVDLKGDES